MPEYLRAKAARKGFDIVSQTTDKDWLLIKCRCCGEISRRRWSVVRDVDPRCDYCIRARRVAAAARIGVCLIGTYPDTSKERLCQLPCGHFVRRQYSRVERAAAGGHALGCEACREARYAEEAQLQGWALSGPATAGRTGYRSYRHRCGQLQNVSVGNMKHGDVDCSSCGESWSSKPSFIYLFRIDLPSETVLKLGYSSNPRWRLRQQLGIARGTPTKVLRMGRMPTGHAAQCEEKAIHSVMGREHPGLVVDKAIYGDAINTRTEIYAPDAIDILQDQLEAVAAKFSDTDDPDGSD